MAAKFFANQDVQKNYLTIMTMQNDIKILRQRLKKTKADPKNAKYDPKVLQKKIDILQKRIGKTLKVQKQTYQQFTKK